VSVAPNEIPLQSQRKVNLAHKPRGSRHPGQSQLVTSHPTALINTATQMQQSQVAQSEQILVLKKTKETQATGALTLLQALPLATSGRLGIDQVSLLHRIPISIIQITGSLAG
jgi:hypothetical protein